MPAPCTCHVPNTTTLFYIGLIESSHQIADFIVSDSTELEG
ncbi:MAG TPA: hypothetical protein VGU68_16645 [Ktedonobacteraceae bacterium]|nr:hypothetical protein [Ktedonobacteraceae bacterium]